jgi:hypothetical protein
MSWEAWLASGDVKAKDVRLTPDMYGEDANGRKVFIEEARATVGENSIDLGPKVTKPKDKSQNAEGASVDPTPEQIAAEKKRIKDEAIAESKRKFAEDEAVKDAKPKRKGPAPNNRMGGIAPIVESPPTELTEANGDVDGEEGGATADNPDEDGIPFDDDAPIDTSGERIGFPDGFGDEGQEDEEPTVEEEIADMQEPDPVPVKSNKKKTIVRKP